VKIGQLVKNLKGIHSGRGDLISPGFFLKKGKQATKEM
jgi:hypothetical protein